MNGLFYFTITDLGRFLGKSAVTVRGWERKGEVVLPRDSGGDRKFTASDVRHVARFAFTKGRINEERYRLIDSALLLLEIIESNRLEKQKCT